MKTVYQLIQEERERQKQNPYEGKEYTKILVKKIFGDYDVEPFFNVLNIKQDDFWVEFDHIVKITNLDMTQKEQRYHIRTQGYIVGSEEILP